MKHTLFLLLLLSHFTYGQKSPWVKNPSDVNYSYTEVVEVDSATASQLFSRAKEGVARIFRNPNDVKRNEDEKAFQILGGGSITAYVKDIFIAKLERGLITFSFTIQCKDGKYRLHITDIEHFFQTTQYGNFSGGPLWLEKPACGTLKMTKKYWTSLREFAIQDIEQLAADLKKILTSPSASNQDNW